MSLHKVFPIADFVYRSSQNLVTKESKFNSKFCLRKLTAASGKFWSLKIVNRNAYFRSKFEFNKIFANKTQENNNFCIFKFRELSIAFMLIQLASFPYINVSFKCFLFSMFMQHHVKFPSNQSF